MPPPGWPEKFSIATKTRFAAPTTSCHPATPYLAVAAYHPSMPHQSVTTLQTVVARPPGAACLLATARSRRVRSRCARRKYRRLGFARPWVGGRMQIWLRLGPGIREPAKSTVASLALRYLIPDTTKELPVA